jgi:Mg2+ and Co2+ transporter CorA
MVALKSHLFADSLKNDRIGDPRQSQSASLLHFDYGRSLRPSLMATDAFYALDEILSFAASSEMQFLNLIDIKLDQYTESTENEFSSLPSLKYTKEILYRHIQKVRQTLDSIRNAKHPKWPKAGTKGRGETRIAADAIEQDFIHLLGRAQMIHERCNEAIVVLMSSVSISESKKAIGQATRVTRLTFLAFLFVPLSFTTSFFGMNVREIANERLSIFWWAVMSIPVSGLTVLLFYWDITWPFRMAWRKVQQSLH